MPSIGGIIGGSISFLLGCFIFLHFRRFGNHIDKTTLRGKYPEGSGKYTAFLGGVVLLYLGLHTAFNLTDISTFMIIAAVPVIWNFRWIGQVLIVFFSRREPSEKKIKTGQYIILVLAVAWSGFAVFLSIKEWLIGRSLRI